MAITEFQYYIYPLFFVVAMLYASVGHGGASGYLAVMALLGFVANEMKINALCMNCFVSIISFALFLKAKKMNWRLFSCLIITSIPFSFYGASLTVNDKLLKILIGIILLFSILQINGILTKKEPLEKEFNPILCLFFGAAIGLFSGLLGIGGGILLSPLLLILGWSRMGEIASISALFIFVNSLAGIFALIFKNENLDTLHLELIPIVVLGAIFGAFIGSKKLNDTYLKIVLSLVLLVASFKLIIP
jgi:uncharacterized protein